MNNFILEQARNGEMTCKYFEEGTYKYLYSKYNPSRVTIDWEIDLTADCYILLGIGLGYEYAYLLKKVDKPIYVIEMEKFFKDYIEEHTKLEPIYIENLNKKKAQLLINKHVIKLSISKYKEFLFSQNVMSKKPLIIGLSHPTIYHDCSETLKQLGYEIISTTLDDIMNVILETTVRPDFLFSINFQHKIAKIAEEFKIPYLSWVVDTPCYTLYNDEILNYNYSHIFHYDEEVVLQLKEIGISSVYYLPVAANVRRFDTIEMNEFTTDITFLGNSCGHNEYKNVISNYLSNKENEEVSKLILNQLNTNENVLEKNISTELIQKVLFNDKNEPRVNVPQLLSPRKQVAFFIGRYHSYVERGYLVKLLEEQFDFKVYGDDYWNEENIYSYAGNAEHFNEMPQIFKSSKINLNLIRSFVDSGLPMRVFDVLGCGGFLLTNAKKDIYKYFEDGKHLVVFHDWNDLIEKLHYYLTHEEERIEIAQNGYEEVKKHHTYEIRLRKMLETIFDKKELPFY